MDPGLAMIVVFTLLVMVVIAVGGAMNYQSVRRGDGVSRRGLKVQYAAIAVMMLLVGIAGVVGTIIAGTFWGLIFVAPLFVVGVILAVKAVDHR
jgi:hypothetical protein